MKLWADNASQVRADIFSLVAVREQAQGLPLRSQRTRALLLAVCALASLALSMTLMPRPASAASCSDGITGDYGSTACGSTSAVGFEPAYAYGLDTSAIGASTLAFGTGATAIGANANATATGHDQESDASYATAIGDFAQAEAPGATALASRSSAA